MSLVHASFREQVRPDPPETDWSAPPGAPIRRGCRGVQRERLPHWAIGGVATSEGVTSGTQDRRRAAQSDPAMSTVTVAALTSVVADLDVVDVPAAVSLDGVPVQRLLHGDHDFENCDTTMEVARKRMRRRRPR